MSIEIIDDDAVVSAAPLTYAVPVFRYYYPSVSAYFYTTNPASEHLDGWVAQGIFFYVLPTLGSGLQPIYRYMYNADTRFHWFTAEGGGGPIDGWTYESIAWYVFSANDDQDPRALLGVYEADPIYNNFYTTDPTNVPAGYSSIGSVGWAYDVNDASMTYGQLITEQDGQCLGIKVMQGGFAGSNQGLNFAAPFKEGDYVMVRGRLAKRYTCIQGGANTLLPNAMGPWTPPS